MRLPTRSNRSKPVFPTEKPEECLILAEASSWFERVRQFREAEMEMLVLQEPAPADLRFHRAYPSQTLAREESLCRKWPNSHLGRG
jgi:hypothetical protein